MIGKLIPTWCWLAAIAALVVGIGVQQVRVNREQTRFANYRAAAEQQARLASEEQRRIETARQSNVDKEVANAQPLIAAEVRDSRVARVDVRVRDAAARVIYRACPNPKPISAGPPAPDPRILLSDLLGRIDARSAELAQIAGERGVAGTLCERSYDAITADSAR